MKISLNWIKEFVDLDGVTKEDIDKKFNLMCAEIENIEVKGADTYGVVFGKILEVKNHPESNKLHILKVDVGTEVLQIVCGAPNVREGMITCVATVGGAVCGHKIGKAKLVGVDSFGMCCSEEELSIGADNSGIIDVDFDAPIGADIKSVLPIDDMIIEIDNKTLTNRPDLWGHYGLAREFAAIFNRSLKPLETLDLSKFAGLKKVPVKIESEACRRYSALTVENIQVKRLPMPMRVRLNYVGMRDINLLADLTNIVMLEVGQPMHAFDNRKVDSIKVRNAVAGEVLTTLEGEQHEIPENAVLICDKHNDPVAIAGIKGGLKSGIAEDTDSVLFESANFEAIAIRKASRAMGLITDASLRYEKSLDPEMCEVAMGRLLSYLHEIDKGVIVTSAFSDVYPRPYAKVSIDVTSKFISSRIGKTVSDEDVCKILTKLGFECSVIGDYLHVNVPSFRATKDISIKEDLVEEVARMLNYGEFEAKPLEFEMQPVHQSAEHELEFKAKKLLASKYGASEVHSYIWNYERFNAEHNIEAASCLHLMDTTNAGQSGIREKMLPTMLKFVAENKEEQLGEVRIFEIGRCVPNIKEDGLANEEKHLCVAFASKTKSQEELFFDLKKFIVDFSVNFVGFTPEFIAGETGANFHKKNSCVVAFRGTSLGAMGVINPKIIATIDKKLNIVGAEFNFALMANQHDYPKKIQVPTQYQSTNLDLNFKVAKDTKYADVVRVLSKIRNKILVGYHLVEVFESEALGDKKSMLFEFEINGKDHTLTGAEIDAFQNDTIDLMGKNGYSLR